MRGLTVPNPGKNISNGDERRRFILQIVQPGLAGLMDGTVSSLAPLFAAALATKDSETAFIVGLAAAVGYADLLKAVEHILDDGRFPTPPKL